MPILMSRNRRGDNRRIWAADQAREKRYVSDHTGAAALLDGLPKAQWPTWYRGCYAD